MSSYPVTSKILPSLVALISLVSIQAQEKKPGWPILKAPSIQEPLAGTARLEETGDLSRMLVESNDRFLDREIDRAVASRPSYWKRDLSSPQAYSASVAPMRQRLFEMLGLDRDARPAAHSGERMEQLRAGKSQPTGQFSFHQARWRAFGEVHGDGELLEPIGAAHANVILIPEADQDGSLPTAARLLAESGCRVLVLRLVPRGLNEYQLSQREWVHRAAFILGRTMAGYEVLKVQSAIDRLHDDPASRQLPLLVAGHGEGGRIALFAAALDSRISGTLISGAFGPHKTLWREPADRNIFGLLSEFDDTELASLIAPRRLVIEHGCSPAYGYRADKDLILKTEARADIPGKPAQLPLPSDDDVQSERDRLLSLVPFAEATLVKSPSPFSRESLTALLAPEKIPLTAAAKESDHPVQQIDADPLRVEARIRELVLHNRLMLIEAAGERKQYFSELKTDSLDSFRKSIEPYREKFRSEVIGDFERPLLPPNARTRPYQEGEKTISYEVVLDVMESGGEKVIAYGIMTLPKDLDLKSGEKRPVVVCQHGLEGTPQDTIGEHKFNAYAAFATRLAEEGFITFAPQNGYKYFDLFRLQQFKAQSIGKTLFSLIVPQHQQITAWLAGQPWVAADRIAFYGLSYGGKAAMRIPPLVDRYCLSICSGDFNEWVWKNAATDREALRYSYANKGEYEIFEWNLGGTFNYAEMAALICPRPFMVERGHFDGVAPDEEVAFEFAKVRSLYAARLKIPDRCEIEWFPGPHAIHSTGTFAFLRKHLGWKKPTP